MSFRKKVYVTAGATSVFYGPGRKEFDPTKPMPSFEIYLKETAHATLAQVANPAIDEGFLGSFMAPRFLHQANLPGFLPFMVPQLQGKPCTGIEGACGTGGRAIAAGVRSILSDLADVVFVAGFEVQNCVKSVYGADILAGAAYYKGERKEGAGFFFPSIFARRAGAYFEKYGEHKTRQALAKWYERAILNARKNPKAQEFHNTTPDLLQLALTPPNPEQFLPHLNLCDCSKVTDGAASLLLASEEGLKKMGVSKDKAIEIIALGEAEGDITQSPQDLTTLTQTEIAARKALAGASINIKDIAALEVHDCFSITGLLMLEAIGLAQPGTSPDKILESSLLPINPSGGLIGFGHPTGASGVRMLVDLYKQLTHQADNQLSLYSPYGMLISMGGDDKTVTVIITSAP